MNANLSLNLQSATTIENAVGGALNDTLIGNSLANRLSGLAGDDILSGGPGDDVYVFDADSPLGVDTIVEGSASGTDTLDFSTTTTIAIAVNLSLAVAQTVNANLTLVLSSGASLENGIGGSQNDILIGNSLPNLLQGNGGDDVLSGLAGNDVLVGGSGKNLLFGGFGNDTLTGGSDEDLMVGARYLLENDMEALQALRSEWTSISSFNDRTGHLLGTLAGGLNAGFALNQATVKEDLAADSLSGGAGKDWYLRNSVGAVPLQRDSVTDSNVDSVFEEISTWL